MFDAALHTFAPRALHGGHTRVQGGGDPVIGLPPVLKLSIATDGLPFKSLLVNYEPNALLL